jgi:Cd2+/Zn2+-exporting ATPase
MEDLGIAYAKDAEAGTIVHVARMGLYGPHRHRRPAQGRSGGGSPGTEGPGGAKNRDAHGDRQSAAEAAAAELGVDAVRAELLPGDKVRLLEELLTHPDRQGLWYSPGRRQRRPALVRAE